MRKSFLLATLLFPMLGCDAGDNTYQESTGAPTASQGDEPTFHASVVRIKGDGTQVVLAEEELTRAQQLDIIERRNVAKSGRAPATSGQALTVEGSCSDFSTLLLAESTNYGGRWICLKREPGGSNGAGFKLPFSFKSYYGSSTDTFSVCLFQSFACLPRGDWTNLTICPWQYSGDGRAMGGWVGSWPGRFPGC